MDGNGSINFVEFSHAFKVADLEELHAYPRMRAATRGSSVAASPSPSRSPSASSVSSAGASSEEGFGGGGWTDRVIQQMSNFLFQYRLELASMFRAFDVNNDGTISCQEFKVRACLPACLRGPSVRVWLVGTLAVLLSF